MTPEQLKASILQRAMEGKLVEQNPDDEPASELLKRIKSEKEKLVLEGTIKRDNKETFITFDDEGNTIENFYDGTKRIFEKQIPKGWTVVYLPDICKLTPGSIKRGPFGSSITKSMFVPNSGEVYKVYEQGNAIRKTVEYGDYWLKKTDYESLKNFSVAEGDVLVSCAGTIGEIFRIPKNFPPGVINQALLKLTLNEEVIDYDFFEIMFNGLVEILKSNAVGSAIKNLASVKFLKYEVPILLPPLLEQKRIVTQTNCLLKKVEEYAESYHKLEKLNTEFPEKLKKSFLQYAMEGKLVEQNLDDEPASELLKRIKSEKEKLVAEGKIKKDKNETYIFKDIDGKYYEKINNKVVQEIEVPFEIPESWEWSRINNIYWNYGQEKPEEEFKYIDTGSIDNKKNIIKYNTLKTITPESAPSRARKKVRLNSVLFSTVRPYLKNIAIVSEVSNYLIASTAFIVMDTSINKKFLKYCLISDAFISQVNVKSTGSSYPAINDKNFNELLIPIPPINEQKRIVDQIQILLEKIDGYAESTIVSEKS